jgi:hypothetical protein
MNVERPVNNGVSADNVGGRGLPPHEAAAGQEGLRWHTDFVQSLGQYGLEFFVPYSGLFSPAIASCIPNALPRPDET